MVFQQQIQLKKLIMIRTYFQNNQLETRNIKAFYSIKYVAGNTWYSDICINLLIDLSFKSKKSFLIFKDEYYENNEALELNEDKHLYLINKKWIWVSYRSIRKVRKNAKKMYSFEDLASELKKIFE